VNVKVTWSRMGTTKPVVSNTVLTPPKGTLDMPMGFVAVKVLGANGLGVEALPVTLTKSGTTYTRSTAADGCAVFAVSSFGTYTATLNVPGYRTLDGQPTASKTTTVSSGTMQQIPFSYDRSATVTATMETLPGWSLPSALPQLSLFNAGLSSQTKTMQVPASGVTTTVGGLWPFSDGYSVWAGGCRQSDPASAGGTRPAQTPLTAGATQSVSVKLAPVTVQVVDGDGNPVTGATVQAVPSVTTGCGAGETLLTLGATDASGALRGSLPAGSYMLSVVGRSPSSGSWPTTPSWLPLDTATDQTVVVA
jgi:hypothetical protein